MNEVSAVVLSARDYEREFEGIDVQLYKSVIRESKDLQHARFTAIEQAKTPWFFFLDDDDDLPDNYLSVIGKCIDAVKANGAAYAHTDEIVRISNGETWLRKSAPYTQNWHMQSPLLVHHLVLFDTAKAKLAVAKLPRGSYNPEFMLFWEAAKMGTAYVPEVGYIWNKRRDAMHAQRETGVSCTRAKHWCIQHP